MADKPVYTVKPRKGGGYALSGPLLPWELRYKDEANAVNYAHHVARITGAIVLVLNKRGDVDFCERSGPLAGVAKY